MNPDGVVEVVSAWDGGDQDAAGVDRGQADGRGGRLEQRARLVVDQRAAWREDGGDVGDGDDQLGVGKVGEDVGDDDEIVADRVRRR